MNRFDNSKISEESYINKDISVHLVYSNDTNVYEMR
jgi:hypothetical protein